MSSKQQHGGRAISTLRNLGPKSAMVLMQCGVRTIDELKELGAVKAFVRARALRPKKVSLNLLWAIAAGLEDRDWRKLTQTEKSKLIGEVRRASRWR
ncbi:MAG: TfoX/Sxy family DNA transformation protein [Aestuariivirga sp.]